MNELQTRPNDSSVLSCRRRFVHAFTKCQEPCCSAFSEEAVRLHGPGGVCRFSPIFSQSVQTLSDVAWCATGVFGLREAFRGVNALFLIYSFCPRRLRVIVEMCLSHCCWVFFASGVNVRIVDDDEINNLAPLVFRFL